MPNAYEIDFLRAGVSNGDAIIIRYADEPGQPFSLHVVDGGFMDTGDEIIEHIEKSYRKGLTIAHVVLSHADNDDACGLAKVLRHFKVANLWMNRPWDYVDEVIDKFHGLYTREGLIKKMRDMHPYLVEMEKIAAEKNIKIHAPLQGADIGPFKVLAPSRERYVRLIPDLGKTPQSYEEAKAARGGYIAEAFRSVLEKVKETLHLETLDENPPATSASNETSVVQFGTFGDKRILLTADVGPEGLLEAADYAESFTLITRPTIIQVPHHGSRRNVTPKVLDRWLGDYPSEKRGTAVASVGKNKEDYPRKKVSNAFDRRGYRVFKTDDGLVHYWHGYERRPEMVDATPIPFSPDVED